MSTPPTSALHALQHVACCRAGRVPRSLALPRCRRVRPRHSFPLPRARAAVPAADRAAGPSAAAHHCAAQPGI
eukprot:3370-Chlamydomonas_euryale.AAC.1